jgi:hypothetical protein
MMAYTKALFDRFPPTEERGDYLKTIDRQGEILNSRVTSMLTVTSLEAGTSQVVLRKLGVLYVAREALIDLELSLKRVFYILHLPPLLGAEVVRRAAASSRADCSSHAERTPPPRPTNTRKAVSAVVPRNLFLPHDFVRVNGNDHHPYGSPGVPTTCRINSMNISAALGSSLSFG